MFVARRPRPCGTGVLVLARLLLWAGLVGPVAAQVEVGVREDLAFDRPEAWAMAYLGAASLFAGLGPAEAIEAGTVRLGAEFGHIPHVSTERRRVGFDGLKLEDLNKTPVFGALRLQLGLPADFALELGWTPPVEIGGARPIGMHGIALERPLWQSEHWTLGARIYHQRGRVRGDITCDRATAAQPIGSPGNPFGCRAPSRDVFHLRQHGAELGLRWRPAHTAVEPFAALALTRMRPRTQLESEVFNVIDRSLLTTRGNIRTLTLGASYRLRPAWEVSGGLAWTPLDVRRPPERQKASDDLYSLRVMLRRDLR
ncbi:MAG TPA: hypothetical protein PKZ76_16030 [Xanthomonadaceae bacterium]|nr:hypothetical protein [Xanthomonadaceae bacterium]